MPKTGRAPKGYYSASQVMRKLGIASSTLYHFVETGRIKRVVPPNMRDGYYVQEEVDKMAQEREIFVLTYMKEPSQFSRAVKEDILGIYEVSTSLWNDRVPSYDARLRSFQQNTEMYYIEKKENIVIGFLGLIPFTTDALDIVMSEAQINFYLTYQKMLEQKGSIHPFKVGQRVESLFLDIAVKKGIPNSEQYGMRLILGGIEVLEDLAKQGSVVKKLYASSSSSDGIQLCKSFGFKELPKLTETTRLRFELDLETTNLSLMSKYQEIVKEQTNTSTFR